MSNKSRSRKQNRPAPAMSPLLRALTFSRAAHEPITRAMLLQAYASLDAFRRGQGSRELFTTLGRQLLIAEELSRIGHLPEAIDDIAEAQIAMTDIDGAEKARGEWKVEGDNYAWLTIALDTFDRQLAVASLEDIAKAEARMIEGLMRTEQELAHPVAA
ncbi:MULTISPECIES: hypothetical protein [Paraburkholderia]|jgi:hypothetical protein|uniref:Fis family transcriptional regulator n=1 Tax=Paraburkholderia largidicola TaxID=3014751 RepID=A0A7I8BWL7_9BURK|nr:MULTISPECIES: hypothetical protein [Paraburkholderia]BEU25854.1 hypothetical protein PBP221_59940 [Paraburkholderia sp. 22B1P]GJH33188.1 hypothetical protein CBA19CS91_10545 [Paraburkholderia hospita]CAG9246923.1 conserved hypothetical protein [Paraburkholderia caribensis]BCF92678.1 hypothetical protein PPGU16_57450 [Paraburkholderia sp. PGU16]GJH06685.1 hypothetical protein CBA19C8_39030 [Paraburkholderia terrae]